MRKRYKLYLAKFDGKVAIAVAGSPATAKKQLRNTFSLDATTPIEIRLIDDDIVSPVFKETLKPVALYGILLHALDIMADLFDIEVAEAVEQ